MKSGVDDVQIIEGLETKGLCIVIDVQELREMLNAFSQGTRGHGTAMFDCVHCTERRMVFGLNEMKDVLTIGGTK